MREMKGALDRVTPRRVIGWAGFADDHAPVQVTISVNGEAVAVVQAQRPRPDIRKAGLHPTGRCGFAFELPEDVQLHEGDLVSARIVGADRDLDGSPMACVSQAQRRRAGGLAKPDSSGGQDRPRPAEPTSLSGSFDKFDGSMGNGTMPLPPRIPPMMGRSSLNIFWDSLNAFMLRELRHKYGSEQLGYLWAIAQPIIFISLLRAARKLLTGDSLAGDDVYGVSSYYYFMLGVIPYMMFQNGFHRAMGAIQQFKILFNYPQVQPIDVVLVRIVIEYLLMTAVMIVMTAGYWWFNFDIEIYHPLGFILILFLLFIFSIGVGLIQDVLVTRYPPLRRVFSIAERPFFFLSGVFFTYDSLPENVQPYLIWNPLLHAVELARAQMLSQFTTPCSWEYLFVCAVSVLLIGLSLYRQQLRQLREDNEGDE